jgi:hypothetical protein
MVQKTTIGGGFLLLAALGAFVAVILQPYTFFDTTTDSPVGTYVDSSHDNAFRACYDTLSRTVKENVNGLAHFSEFHVFLARAFLSSPLCCTHLQ